MMSASSSYLSSLPLLLSMVDWDVGGAVMDFGYGLQAPTGSSKPMVAQIILAKVSGSQNNNRSRKYRKGMFRESNKRRRLESGI